MEAEKLVETKVCKHCQVKFEITDKDLEFYEKVSPGFGGKKYLISTPTLCPECRMIQRFSWRNERKLYHRKCDLTGKQIISIYSPDKPYKVYDQNEWNSDKWNGRDYAMDFDFSKPFFTQLDELIKATPKISMFVSNNENSEYTNGAQQNKDCYMIFVSDHNDSCLFSYSIFNCVKCIDCFNCYDCEVSIECVDCSNCYNLKYSQNSYNCSESYFLYDCKNCKNCIGCFGLIGKEYHIFNKSYTKEEYKQKLSELNSFGQNGILALEKIYFKNIGGKKVYQHYHGNNNENVSGDYLINSKNCENCYDSGKLEDCKNIIFGFDSKDCYDGHVVVDSSELCYQTVSTIKQYKVISTFCSWYSNNSFYLDHCISCSDCFGCSGLKNQQYCILNKQYTKEEYEELVPKVIEYMKKTGEWGEFFPSSISPFGYNETVANESFPLTKEQAISQNFKWSDYEKQNGYDGEFYSPLDIKQYDEKIVGKELALKNIGELLKGILQCEVTKKPFKIIKQELEFYRKYNLPIPKRHPDQRHLDRMKLRNPRKLYDRKCDKCGVDMKTTYAPERPEIVYCQTCYDKEIY